MLWPGLNLFNQRGQLFTNDLGGFYRTVIIMMDNIVHKFFFLRNLLGQIYYHDVILFRLLPNRFIKRIKKIFKLSII